MSEFSELQLNNIAACHNRAELRLLQGSIDRQTQLERMNREQLRNEAAKHGIPRPDGGWIDVVPHILEFEGLRRVVPNPPGSTCPCHPPELQISVAARNYETYSQQSAASAQWEGNPNPNWRFTTEYYKSINLPVCPKCGEQAPRTDTQGRAMCAIASSATCPVLNPLYC